jgi:hypothetical protein
MRSLPAAISRRWRVLPYHVSEGALHLAGTDVPTDDMRRDLRRFSSLEIRFRLITPAEFETLAEQHLPPA